MATKKVAKYPRIIVSGTTHAKVMKAAKKAGRAVGNEVVLAGLKALGY